MKVLVTGYNGQLGYDVIRVLKEENIDCLGIDINELDLTKKDDVFKFVKDYKSDVIVHCAAYTQVDKAEDNRELAYDVNVNAVKYITDVCKEMNIKLCFFSTDYVFEGTGEEAFEVDHKKSPVDYYGETKDIAEEYIKKTISKYFIIRISWVFGINGNNFVKTMLRLSETRNEVTVVNDQVGSPTYTLDLAYLIRDMIKTDKYGIYHATNENYCSWNEFAQEIFRLGGKDVKVKGIPSSEYPTRAKRPYNSRMSKKALDENGFNRLPSWQDALGRYMEELKNDKLV